MSLLECNARAALCRQLARLEPDSKNLWLAEAERWSRLTQAPNVTVVTRLREPAGTWRWKVLPKRNPLDVNVTEEKFEFGKTAGRDALEEVLSG